MMELEMPKPSHKIIQQPTLQFDMSEAIPTPSAEIPSIAASEPVVPVQLVEDPFMPVLRDDTPTANPVEEILSKTTVDKSINHTEYLEITLSSNQQQPIVIDFSTSTPVPSNPVSKNEPVSNIQPKDISPINKDASNNERSLSSGSFLAKPVQIYAEETPSITESNSKEEPLPLRQPVQEDEPVIEMQLVVKESQKAAEEEPLVQQTQSIMKSTVEEPAMQDETEELRRRATERITKLRNLSFNINAADPNNEFETVPAYLRRNMEMHNQIADVESFYSNYTVKSDDNNQADISAFNTFLDGKKPD
ncbi:MAG: hypothetical protein WD135_09410 [Ferruginibacter sp.]